MRSLTSKFSWTQKQAKQNQWRSKFSLVQLERSSWSSSTMSEECILTTLESNTDKVSSQLENVLYYNVWIKFQASSSVPSYSIKAEEDCPWDLLVAQYSAPFNVFVVSSIKLIWQQEIEWVVINSVIGALSSHVRDRRSFWGARFICREY